MFTELTYEQQLNRLADAADRVLPAFGVSDADIRLLSYVSNAVFAVDHPQGHFVLRIHCRAAYPHAWIDSEMMWLTALYGAGLCVPQPVMTTSGEWLAHVTIAGFDAPVMCSMLHWLEGESYAASAISAVQVECIGHYLAQMHQFALSYQRPANFARPRLDWEGLFGRRSLYNPGGEAAFIQPHQQRVMDTVAERVRQVMAALDDEPSAFGLIHADMIAKNLLFRGEEVCAIDFDTSAFGYFLYDLAPVLLQFSPQANYADLKAALWQGYTATLPLPAHYADYLETFVAGRHVASMRWVAANLHNPHVRDQAVAILADRTMELEDFLTTGRLERRSKIL